MKFFNAYKQTIHYADKLRDHNLNKEMLGTFFYDISLFIILS